MGIDLSEERILTGKKFLPILFNHYKSLIDLITISCILDAGSGGMWFYKSKKNKRVR